jgi:hypothetical protein
MKARRVAQLGVDSNLDQIGVNKFDLCYLNLSAKVVTVTHE